LFCWQTRPFDPGFSRHWHRQAGGDSEEGRHVSIYVAVCHIGSSTATTSFLASLNHLNRHHRSPESRPRAGAGKPGTAGTGSLLAASPQDLSTCARARAPAASRLHGAWGTRQQPSSARLGRRRRRQAAPVSLARSTGSASETLDSGVATSVRRGHRYGPRRGVAVDSVVFK
jgi:hypothetical protein